MTEYEQKFKALEDDLKVAQIALAEAFTRHLPGLMKSEEFKKEHLDAILANFDSFQKELIPRMLGEITNRILFNLD